GNVNISDKERYLIVFIQAVPEQVGKSIDIIWYRHQFRFSLKALQGVSVAFIAMDKVPLSVLGVLVSKSKAIAGVRTSVIAFEDRHGVIVSAVLNMHDTGDTRCIIGPVRLKLSASQRLLKGQLFVHSFIDRVGLVSIGDN